MEEQATNTVPTSDASGPPKVGSGFYATFCEDDPLSPSNVGEDATSSGGGASGCLFSGGAEGTGRGTDYDKTWPIETPEDLPDPDPVDPCHDHDALGGNHDPDLCPPDPVDPDPKPEPEPPQCTCSCEDECCAEREYKCDLDNCCLGLCGLSTAQLVLMLLATAALMMQ